MRSLTFTAAMAALFASLMILPAAAAPPGAGMGALAAQAHDSPIVEAQFGRRGPRGPGPVIVGPRRGGFVGGPRRRGWGPGVGAGVAIGVGAAIIGGMIAAEQARAAAQEEALVAACARRFRSYDPMTRTYRGRGGQIFRCP